MADEAGETAQGADDCPTIWTADVCFTITVRGTLEAADQAQMERLLAALGPNAVFNDPYGIEMLVEGVTYIIEDDGEVTRSAEEVAEVRAAAQAIIEEEGY